MTKNKITSYFPSVTILVVFFFSGASALVYQTVWIRKFGLVFGVDLFATSTVITAFMAGLALGSLLVGKIVDKHKNPLLLLVYLELGIGLFALLFPFTFKLLDTLYVGLYHSLSFGFYSTQLYRFSLAFLYLLIPTTLMGGTLPVLSKVMVKNIDALGWNIGRLYSANNFGAFVGCFLAGFFMMRSIGLHNSIYAAAGLNMLSALIVFLLLPLFKKNVGFEQDKSLGSHDRKLPGYVVRFILWAFAIEGFAALAYEVIWTRILLGFSYDKSVYFYTTVILCFIFGLSVGSLLIAKFIDKKRDLLLLFAGIETAIGLMAIAALALFPRIARVLSVWRLTYSENWWASLGKEYAIFFAVMLLPALLMGMTFPVVSKICTPHLKRLGTRIGEIGFLDTVGSIFGAFAAGFVLIPLFGVVTSVLIAAFINLTIALLTILLHPHRNPVFKTASMISIGVLALLAVLILPGNKYFQNWQTKRASDRLLYYHEGADAAIAVAQHNDGVKFLAINGSVTAFTNYGDTRVHKMLGYLPWLLHDDPHNSLVIGLGMGITVQSLMLPGMEQVDCVEINRGIVEAAARHFATENNRVLEEDRLNLIIDDGRSYLHTTARKYDIITSNAVHARLSGNLYTEEFYKICRERLTDDGVMCQWTSTNWLSPAEFTSLIAAFHAVFPHTSLWLVNAGHLLMVGTPEPIQISYADFEQKFNLPKLQSDLHHYSLGSPELFLAHFVCDEARLPALLKDAPMNRDDHPLAELSRVVSKMQIPEILLPLIHIKTDLVDRLIFRDEGLEEMVSIKRQVADYAAAEKYYLEGVFARNIYNEPLLALNMITEALKLQPDDYRYREEAASLNLFLAGQPDVPQKDAAIFMDNAIGHLWAMTAAHPIFAFDWNNLGYALMNYGNLDEATAAFEKAINLAPDYPLPRIYLASIIGGRGHLDDAEHHLRIAVENFPDELEGWYRLGVVYELMSRRTEAIEAYENIIKRNASYRDVTRRLRHLAQLAG